MAECGPSPDSFAPAAGIKLDVDVVRHAEAWHEARIGDAALARAARAALAEAPALPAGDYELTILLTDDEEMRRLNRDWRGKNASTNVLSFPASDAVTGPGLLGDIALAYETIRDEAHERELAPSDHVAHLVVHGVLHLLGFDHGDDAQAERMEALERRALASLGIADPYAEPAQAAEFAS
jgi:probable rRNA maturation factor